jgi:RHS repeat-associated protein
MNQQGHIQFSTNTHQIPFGEDWVDQRNSSWNTPYTFSGKEKDAETGYSYFGARYYDSGLSIWLSVDPMSDKYPSLSPYSYCANNPIMMVDPDGRKFHINGAFAQELISQLNHYTKLELYIDEDNYVRSKKNQGDGGMLDNILLELIKEDSQFNISVTTTDDSNEDGGYDGTLYIKEEAVAVGYQTVNPMECAKRDVNVGDDPDHTGGYVVHEIVEAYFGCLLTLQNKQSSPAAVKKTFLGFILNKYPKNCVYPDAHKLANTIMKGGYLINNHNYYPLQEMTKKDGTPPQAYSNGTTYHRVDGE